MADKFLENMFSANLTKVPVHEHLMFYKTWYLEQMC